MKGGDYVLGYRLTVNCDTNGYLTWSLLFDNPTGKYGDTDTDKIFSVAREFVTALEKLQSQNNNNNVKTLRAVLNEIRYHFDTTNGLIVADGAAPEETWPIDNSELLERINEADGILSTFEQGHFALDNHVAEMTKEEQDNLKADLLNFVHHIASGYFDKPEYIPMIIPAIKLADKLFSR